MNSGLESVLSKYRQMVCSHDQSFRFPLSIQDGEFFSIEAAVRFGTITLVCGLMGH